LLVLLLAGLSRWTRKPAVAEERQEHGDVN
jgi:hypothetical protein